MDWSGYKKEKGDKTYHIELGVFVNAKTAKEAEKFVIDSLVKGSRFFGGYSIKAEEMEIEK